MLYTILILSIGTPSIWLFDSLSLCRETAARMRANGERAFCVPYVPEVSE